MRRTLPLLSILLTALTSLALVLTGPTPSAAAATTREVGLNLDIARRYWSPEAIKTMIGRHAAAGGTYLHLHASDDEAYGIESPLLGQTAGTARVSGSRYVNPRTGKPFLTTAQLRDLRSYAASLGVEVFLEVDTPGHMRSVRELMQLSPSSTYPVSQVFSSYAPYELDVHSPTALAFAKRLYTEVSGVLPGARMHIGGDEFAGGKAEQKAWTAYANSIASMLYGRGVPDVLVWNDSLTKTTLGQLNTRITVTYWNYDVWGKPNGKSTMPQVMDAGHKVINYNGYHQYWVPSLDEPQSDRDYTINDLRTKWNRGTWTQTRAIDPNDPRLLGATFSIWGEHSAGMTDQMLIDRGTPILTALAQRARG